MERAAATLHNFYSAQSWFQEGIDAFQIALDRIAGQPVATSEQASVLCDLLGRQAQMYTHIGELETARLILEKAQSYLDQVESATRRSSILGEPGHRLPQPVHRENRPDLRQVHHLRLGKRTAPAYKDTA